MSKPEQSPSDRCFTAWAIVGELVAGILLSTAAKTIGARLSILAEAGWLPGLGDARAVAALTNRPESSISSIVADKPRPKFQVGRQPFYRLSDFAVTNTQTTKKRRAK